MNYNFISMPQGFGPSTYIRRKINYNFISIPQGFEKLNLQTHYNNQIPPWNVSTMHATTTDAVGNELRILQCDQYTQLSWWFEKVLSIITKLPILWSIICVKICSFLFYTFPNIYDNICSYIKTVSMLVELYSCAVCSYFPNPCWEIHQFRKQLCGH